MRRIPSEDSIARAREQEEEQAAEIIRKYASAAAFVSLVPLPYLDMVAALVPQQMMVRELAHLHAREVDQVVVGSVIASLVAGAGSLVLAGAARSSLRFVPVLGPVLGYAASSAILAATTVALGTVLHRHFQAGGTLRDFASTAWQDDFNRTVRAQM